MYADAAVYEHRRRDRVEQPLGEHERAFVADPAGGLVALGDDRVGVGVLGCECLLQPRRHDVCPQSGAVRRCHQPAQLIDRRVREHDRVEALGCGLEDRVEQLPAVEQRAAATVAELAEPVQLREPGVEVDG